jgi:hypothetical protein
VFGPQRQHVAQHRDQAGPDRDGAEVRALIGALRDAAVVSSLARSAASFAAI